MAVARSSRTSLGGNAALLTFFFLGCGGIISNPSAFADSPGVTVRGRRIAGGRGDDDRGAAGGFQRHLRPPGNVP